MTAPALIEKPPYGMPCNGCGLCCREELCPLAEIVFAGRAAPCPAIEAAEDGRFVCGLIVHPMKYAPIRTSVYGSAEMSAAAVWAVGVGVGCDAQLADEGDPPESYRHAIREAVRDAASKRRRTEKLWGGPR